ncbi:hypothetical protein, partial [Flavobacterium sp. fv08]
MKNRLLPLFVVLATFSARSQVGIGTKTPNASAQLEITTTDKADEIYGGSNRGILIPRVSLTSTLIYAPIVGNKTESLLVFNTKTTGDVTPGYYFWLNNKWNRLAVSGEAGSGTGKDGKVGLKEGTVPPGVKGTSTYPGDDINIYTDTTSGIVYVQTSTGTWTPINGKDGKEGIIGGTGAPGTSGAAGINKDSTFYIDTKTGTVYILTPGTDPLDPKNWVPINGKNGIDGKNGMNGGNGVPGTPGTPGLDATIQMYIDYTTGIVYVRDPKDNTKWVPLNGKDGAAGNNGKDGMIGGKGAPGTPGAAGINKDSTIYIDTETGTVYILTPGTDPKDPKNWVPINGKNGIDGKNGMNGGNGAPGTPGAPGLDATIQMYIDYTTGIVYVRDPKDNTKWVPLNGKNGIDGKNGIAGGNGAPGTTGAPGLDGTIQMYIDYTTGIVYVRDPKDNTKWVPLNGKNGIDGKNGIAGGKGVPGATGTPALDSTIQMYIDYNTGIIYVRDPKNPDQWIPTAVKGEKGDKGDAGASAYDIWKGQDGNNGKTLTEFLAGLKGATGASGADGKSFTYTDFTKEQLDGLKGATGATGAKGDTFTFADLTPDQIAALKGA